MKAFLIAAALAFVAAPLVVRAAPQAPQAALVQQYTHDAWGREEGLPQSSVVAVAQTSDGYLWLATEDGLVRFDGVRFTVYNSATTSQITTNDIMAVYAGRDGRLWVGTAGGGLLLRDRGAFTVFTTDDGLPSNVISAIFEDASGVLWVGTRGGGLARRAGSTFETYGTANGLPGNVVTAITQDAEGAIWVATHVGAARLRDGRFEAYGMEDGLPSDDVREVYASRDGSVWLGTRGGLARVRDGRVAPFPLPQASLVISVVEDREGVLWVGTTDGGVRRVTSDGPVPFEHPPDLGKDVRAIHEDSEGNVWVGTGTTGLHRLKKSKVLTYGTREGLSHDVALGTIEDADGTLWVATYGGGLNRFRDGRWSALTTRNGLSSNLVLSLARSSVGGLWVGTSSGVDRLRDGRLVHYGRAAGLNDEPVLAMIEDRRGDLWIGTRTGLWRWSAGGVRRYTQADGLGSDIVLAILERRDGSLWVGTDGGGLSRLVDDRFLAYSRADGLPSEVVWAITEDMSGTLWLGTSGGGLVRFHDGRFRSYTTRHGLVHDNILQVVDDRAGTLWLSGSQGVVGVRIEDLDAIDDGRLTQAPVRWFTEADGMGSREVNGGIQPAGWLASDGRIWFPTIRGVVAIDPARFERNTRPPPVVLEEVVVDGQAMDPREAIVAPPGARTLEFRYTALTFTAPQNARFRYRLEGYEDAWVDAGTRRAAYYTNIPPGEYRFRVVASNEDGVWNDTGSVAALRLTPFFYQTRTFHVLWIAGVGLLLLGLHRARVSGLKARGAELARLAEDRRLALEAKAQSEARFHGLFDNMLEGVYLRGADGRILLANRAFAHLVGYADPSQLTGVHASSLYETPDHWTAVTTGLDASGQVRHVEVALRRQDGTVVEALESARAVREGGELRYEGIVVDLTERKNLERQVQQLQKMQAIGRLAGAVAHDFNNLLTPIIGYSEMVLTAIDRRHPARQDIEEIRRAGESGVSLTRQLLAFSRHQVIDRQALNLNDVARRFERILRRLIGEHITLSLTCDEALGSVTADVGQMEQVLLNLAVNARDAMPSGGDLTIETSNVTVDAVRGESLGVPPGPYVRLSVVDTGVGIDPAIRARLFEPFFTTKAHGTGLGLATVHAIVTQSGGVLDVESEPRHGSVFSIYLPRTASAARPEPAQAPGPVEPGHGETVLLVEDSDIVRRMAQRVLEGAGYVVLAARHVQDAEAINARHDGPIHLLLTDVIMPGMNGPALAARLRAQRAGLRVLYMTGYLGGDIDPATMEAVSAALVHKPFTPSALLEQMRRVLDASAVSSPPAPNA